MALGLGLDSSRPVCCFGGRASVASWFLSSLISWVESCPRAKEPNVDFFSSGDFGLTAGFGFSSPGFLGVERESDISEITANAGPGGRGLDDSEDSICFAIF